MPVSRTTGRHARRAAALIAVCLLAPTLADAGRGSRSPASYVDPFNGTAAGAPNFGTGGGKNWRRPWISFSRLLASRILRFRLGPTPDRAWGSAAKETRPSYPPTARPPSCR